LSISPSNHPAAVVVTTPTDREVRMERVFNASRDRVWRAYTDPQLVAQWWGRGNKLSIERMEVERGGHWRFVEDSAQGIHGFEGRYRAVSPLQCIVATFEWDGMPGHVSVSTTVFEEIDQEHTKVTVTSLFHTAEERDGMIRSGMKEGLAQSYSVLDVVLAAWHEAR
jgi:uncharacterized protein YndB with AHSA1/START domain